MLGLSYIAIMDSETIGTLGTLSFIAAIGAAILAIDAALERWNKNSSGDDDQDENQD